MTAITRSATHPEALTHEEAVTRAKALAPHIRARASGAEAMRRQPEETIGEIAEAGLVRLLTPRRWGGHELGFDAFVDSVIEVGKADASTAWIFSFLNIHSWILAQFPEEAQTDIWADAPDARIADSFIPAGRPSLVEGGYRISGNWPWVSGIDNCDWVILGGLIPPRSEGAPPEVRLFLLPKFDCKVEDTWFVAGQRASGSSNVLVENTFVPEHRTVKMSDLREGQGPGTAVNPGPLYSLPMVSTFMSALVSPILGATIGAYELWRDTSRGKLTMFTHEQVAALSHRQIGLAEISAEIDAAQLVLRRCLNVIRGGGPLTLEQRARNRRDYAYVARLCVGAVQEIYLASGGGANYETNPLQRYWRDVHAMSVHAGINFDSAGEHFGRMELGLPRNPREQYF